MRTQCSTELERMREQERMLRQKGEQAVADLRTELAAVQARAQDAAVAGAEERAQAEATATRRLVVGRRRAAATRTKFEPGPV